ncbi:unnamed protein product [Gongylonema pulchrum]|uniref:HABP4_PAI-RBP1 domain-containing protein n=1 Tax=Gongylonema pulchrum TaxID=637853 RepID=A0A183EN14_9BILA|nr:unnamed protein product [Gongylonema pulchrum]
MNAGEKEKLVVSLKAGIGSKRDGPLNTADWKYADDVAAPLASGEPLDEQKEEQSQMNGTRTLGSQQKAGVNGAASDSEPQLTSNSNKLKGQRQPGSLDTF